MAYYYIYQPTNPVCGYAGTFKGPLENTCGGDGGGGGGGSGGGGGGGGGGGPEKFTLNVDGEATDTLVIHEQNTPE